MSTATGTGCRGRSSARPRRAPVRLAERSGNTGEETHAIASSWRTERPDAGLHGTGGGSDGPAGRGGLLVPHSNKDSATGYVTATDAAVRSGASFSCTIYGRAYKGYSVAYDCYTIGDTYNGYSTWTWGYVSAIGKSGWINDALLSNHGSSKFCG
jgi:hypothetical protein